LTLKQKPLAAITGGTGFVGRYIISDLMKAGWKIRLLVRSEPMHPLIPELDAEIIISDLSDQKALEQFCADADAVIHVGGLIKAKNRTEFFAVNEKGSKNLAKAAAKVVPKAIFVVVSSMAARVPGLSDYAASKRAGEDAIIRNFTGPVTILRPSAVYGRWDKETLPLFQMASKGRIFMPRDEAARICLINVADVSSAVATYAKIGKVDALYELSDENIYGYTWSEIALTVGKAVGKNPKITSIPTVLSKSGGNTFAYISQLMGQTPFVTAGKIAEILHGQWGSSPTFQPQLEIWRPQISLECGFTQTAKWYALNKLI
jgi:nucleoside-diphosphate-sugar epimerase